ncbi:MAG: MFS transporter, partial [Clostridiales bacterium]|nr:MFS transporter [Clostridiales bacterium]
RTVSLLIGAFSLTVILAEFPSGVFADLYGRKRAFLLSALLSFLSYGLLLFSRSLAMLFPAVVAKGLGRAFSSGSVEALAIDEAGEGALVQTASQLSILESAGLAAGALAGGLLSGVGDRCEGNLLANLALYASVFLLTAAFVREHPRAAAHPHAAAQVLESLAFLRRRGAVRALLVFSLSTGFALISLETYWQLALSEQSPAPWVFGAVSFLGFLAVIFGSKFAERLLTKNPERGPALLVGFKALLGAGCLMLFVRSRQPLFIGIYSLCYIFLGGGGVAESALLNKEAPTGRRAGILSLFSLLLQIGGLCASLTGFFVSARADFRAMWAIAGGLLILGAAVSIRMLAAKKEPPAFQA